MPFVISPRYYQGIITSNTVEYCFNITVIPRAQIVPVCTHLGSWV
jgi:hypothetical protein